MSTSKDLAKFIHDLPDSVHPIIVEQMQKSYAKRHGTQSCNVKARQVARYMGVHRITDIPSFAGHDYIKGAQDFLEKLSNKSYKQTFISKMGKSLLRYCLPLLRECEEDTVGFQFGFQRINTDDRCKFLQIWIDGKSRHFIMKIFTQINIGTSLAGVRQRLISSVEESFHDKSDYKHVRFDRTPEANGIVIDFGTHEHWVQKDVDDAIQELKNVCTAVGMLFTLCMATNGSLSAYWKREHRTRPHKVEIYMILESWGGGYSIESVNLQRHQPSIALSSRNQVETEIRSVERNVEDTNYMYQFMWYLYANHIVEYEKESLRKKEDRRIEAASQQRAPRRGQRGGQTSTVGWT